MSDQYVLDNNELDVIGEIMNISMGSAATAVSSMLDKQVTITTPNVTQEEFRAVDYSRMEPAIIVKIKYTEGIEGANVIMFRKHDMQIILNLLMGNDFTEDDSDFEFDEMSMSAACEVMNQMMGASATALSEILGKAVNISTPEAMLAEAGSTDIVSASFGDLQEQEHVIVISFKMMIKDVMDSDFSCIMPVEMTRNIVENVMGDVKAETPTETIPEQPPVAQQPPLEQPPTQMPPPMTSAVSDAMDPTAIMQQTEMPPLNANVPEAAPIDLADMQQPTPPVQPVPQMPQTTMPQAQQPQATPPTAVASTQAMPMVQQPIMPQQQTQLPYGMPVPGMQQPPYYPTMPYATPDMSAYAQSMPYGYPQQPQPQAMPQQAAAPAPQINIKKAQFPDFSSQTAAGQALSGTNINLLMAVPLEVSVVIGKTKRKIKEIMEFGQGTVIELDKQTGAPADIYVNGQLLAYGDVVVIGDNFGVRITEIVGTKELLDSLNTSM